MIGVIAKGGQFNTLKKFFKKRKIKYLIYKPNNKNYFDQKKFDELKNCKIIFILSPNKTHFDYIKKLYKNRYIFCEKPPVISKKQLLKLKKFRLKKFIIILILDFQKLPKYLKNKKNINLEN